MDPSSNIPMPSSPLLTTLFLLPKFGLLPPCCSCWNLKGWKAGCLWGFSNPDPEQEL